MQGIGDLRGGERVNNLAGDLTPDPCRAKPAFTLARFALFTLLVLVMVPGSVILFILLENHPYGLQITSIVEYTSAVVLYTFSKSRFQRRYLFGCPCVRLVLPQLLLRHFGFLVALVVLETVALQIRPHLPAFWLVGSGRRGSMPPFVTVLFILCACLALAQIISNRTLLRRTHAEGTLDPNGEVPPSR